MSSSWGSYQPRFQTCFLEPKSYSVFVVQALSLVWIFAGPFVVQSFSHVQIFAIPWTGTCLASLSFTVSCSLLKLISIEPMMPSSHFVFCHLLFLLPSNFPASGFFLMNWLFVSGNQCIGTSASGSVLLVNIQDWFPLRWSGLISLLKLMSSELLMPSNHPILCFPLLPPALNLSQQQNLGVHWKQGHSHMF